jgi:hypothetical protein
MYKSDFKNLYKLLITLSKVKTNTLNKLVYITENNINTP